MRDAARAWWNGVRSVVAAPRLVGWIWLSGLLFALPLALVVADSIHGSLGASTTGRDLLEGLDLVWLDEHRSGTRGLGATLEVSQIGAGAFLDNLESWFSGELFTQQPGIVAAGLAFVVIWAFLLGGAMAYLQSGERPRLRGFAAFGGEFVFRFVRLAGVMGVAYYFVYRFSRWLFERVEEAVRDVTVEKAVLVYYLVAAVVTVVLLALLRMASDYAKAAIVVEDRRSALLAALRGFRFVLTHPIRTFALVVVVALVGLGALWLYDLVGSGVGQRSWPAVVAAFAVGQLFLAFRIALRLSLVAGQLHLYQQLTPFGGLPSEDLEA